ncbi:MAG: M61 family metallopeptidase [Novosphingobium sp.]|nr:M61 family metallopeptidase [Novosphingobium sp.]
MRSLSVAAALVAAISVSVAAHAAPVAKAIALPSGEAIADPADTPWPGGTIGVDIDASDTQRGIYRVTQSFPLAPGMSKVTLLFPEWLPGNHAPRGPIAELTDLRLTADGAPVAWRRDPIDVYAFHVDLPSGARELTARFIHTSPLQTNEGRVTMTPEMLNLQWEKMTLYPAGHYVRQIAVKPTVTLPQGWTPAAALDGMRITGNRVTWDKTDYETLVDSPIFAGRFFRKWDLGDTISLNVVADAPDLLNLAPRNLANLSAMSDEALAIFGKAPYDRYEFLVALSDRLGGIGLEHLRSSENQLEPYNFIEWEGYDWDRNVLPHELVHSWNGKYRRPARLWIPDYRQPMQDELLWVYEGQTQFWGLVLAARSGVQTRDMVLATLASKAGALATSPGRAWRSLADTTLDPIVAARKPKPYSTLARGEDYYWEGALVWLEADQIIRKGTGGRKGLDDFAKAFFSHEDGTGRVSTYEFGDVVATLNGVHEYDWAGFLKDRIDRSGRPAPLAGIESAGYRLVWKDEPNAFDKALMDHRHNLQLMHSLGVLVDRDGTVLDVQWDSPAFRAGVVTGVRIIAVDSVAFSSDGLKQAISRAQGGSEPIHLLVRRGDRFSTVPVAYQGGLRWPWLVRAPELGQAPLDRLLAPRRNSMSK